MKYKELTVRLPTTELRAFLQEGFYKCGVDAMPIAGAHSHNYAEMHIVLGGRIVLSIGGDRFEVVGGNMLIIPPRTLHATVERDSGTRHTAFQIDLERDEPVLLSQSPAMLAELFSEIERSASLGEYERLSAIIALLCCDLSKNATRVERNVTDPAFLIQEFFSTRYSENIRPRDLAEILHISERHAERLVILHTGMTFVEKLTDTRLTVADRLMRSGETPLSAIAEYVGYRSYSGFWKALKRRNTFSHSRRRDGVK